MHYFIKVDVSLSDVLVDQIAALRTIMFCEPRRSTWTSIEEHFNGDVDVGYLWSRDHHFVVMCAVLDLICQ